MTSQYSNFGFPSKFGDHAPKTLPPVSQAECGAFLLSRDEPDFPPAPQRLHNHLSHRPDFPEEESHSTPVCVPRSHTHVSPH